MKWKFTSTNYLVNWDLRPILYAHIIQIIWQDIIVIHASKRYDTCKKEIKLCVCNNYTSPYPRFSKKYNLQVTLFRWCSHKENYKNNALDKFFSQFYSCELTCAEAWGLAEWSLNSFSSAATWSCSPSMLLTTQNWTHQAARRESTDCNLYITSSWYEAYEHTLSALIGPNFIDVCEKVINKFTKINWRVLEIVLALFFLLGT